MPDKHQTTPRLFAIFDAARVRSAQEIFSFLILSEMERLSRGCESVHVLLVWPIDETGDITILPDAITLSAALALLPSVKGFTICRSPSDVVGYAAADERSLFPNGDDLVSSCHGEGNTHSFLAELRTRADAGRAVPALTVPRQPMVHVETWMRAVVGARRLVTLTLDICDGLDHQEGRIEAWARFLQDLDQSKYCPVLVMDDWSLGDPLCDVLANVPVFPGTGPYSPMRFALYSCAHVNFLEGSESIGLCRAVTEIRFIHFDATEEDVERNCQGRHFVMGAPSGKTLGAIFRDFEDQPVGNSSCSRNDEGHDHQVMSIDGFYRKALTLQAQSIANVPDAVRIYSEILKVRPHHAGALQMLGVNALLLGNVEEAVNLLKASAQIDPTDPTCHFNLGNALLVYGAPEAAVPSYKTAIALEPEFSGAWLNLASVLQDLGQFEEAVECYRDAHQCTVRSFGSQFNYAYCLAKLGRYDEAAEAFQMAGNKYVERMDDGERANIMFGAFARLQYLRRNAHFLAERNPVGKKSWCSKECPYPYPKGRLSRLGRSRRQSGWEV